MLDNEKFYQKCVNVATAHKGKLLSQQYINAQVKLEWECEFNHKWWAKPSHIWNGRWCRTCFYNKRRLKLEDLINFAKSKGGDCLSTEYKNTQTKMLWKCSEGHIWPAITLNIKNNKWCPCCQSHPSRSEEYCRNIFEKLSGYKFPKIRPGWLINNKGYRLELDGYCEELKLAFEHQGQQHYNISHFSPTLDRLKMTQSNDLCKVELCKKYNIKLIVIPQMFVLTSPEQLEIKVKEVLCL